MDEKSLFMKFWTREAETTRKVISRIPQDRSDYRPDPKARNAREIAWLLLQETIALADGLEKSSFEWTELPVPGNVAGILEAYEREHPEVARRLEAVPAARWEASVPFIVGGQEVMRETAQEMAWGFLFDIIHHRGQLSTYLRPMGSTVPSIYGPTADEPM